MTLEPDTETRYVQPYTRPHPEASAQWTRCCATLMGPWTTYILWLLQNESPLRLRRAEAPHPQDLVEGPHGTLCGSWKPRVLINRDYQPTIPPTVNYALTARWPRTQAGPRRHERTGIAMARGRLGRRQGQRATGRRLMSDRAGTPSYRLCFPSRTKRQIGIAANATAAYMRKALT